ncbi:unnamed protein product [Pneumocystis jirovecii]|uniref:Coatomer subunit epsilon n=2 Tax=Pneumocystis jirovecii TaxID=42068 RepID=L0PFM0_PNEJI|nr:uncharacterized protein T551_03537 [Pneumocystis jirovecii RU7]KTW26237.1 hypothetical protein T551_03537 [Pneumocystis jirovecii RU7]CCJ31027.1 unnamed protein product [Pneumocystis jirovecii]
MFEETEELIEARNHLYQGCYTRLLDETTNKVIDNPTNENFDDASTATTLDLALHVLKGRAKCLSGGASELLWELRDATSPALIALRGWARTLEGDPDGIDEICASIDALDVSDSDPSATTVHILAAAALFCAGRVDEARTVLGRCTHVEAVALAVQMSLSESCLEAAQREIDVAKAWAKDDLVMQLAEAWVDMYRGGQRILNAFYIYEDLAQTVPSSTMLTGQAVTELLLGRATDAAETLKQALELSPNDGDALANAVVAATLLGNDATNYIELLTLHHPSHPWVVSTSHQSTLFDQLSKTYLTEA